LRRSAAQRQAGACRRLGGLAGVVAREVLRDQAAGEAAGAWEKSNSEERQANKAA
jgi:hypothetical protein